MSDSVVIDLTNYKDRVGSRVPPGRYRVRVEDVESDQSRSGNPMINVWFTIMGGEFDGQTIVDRLTITEKSLFRVVGFMQAIGLPTPKKRIQVVPGKFVGQVLDVDVDDGEPYNGRVKSEVRGYVRVSRAAANSSDGEESDGISEFSADTSSNAEQVTTGAADTPQSQPATPAVDADSGDDEVDLSRIDL